MLQKLKSKGFPESLARDVLDELGRDGLQSDGRFLESLVRGHFAKGHGPSRIRQELWLKGVRGEELGDCLAEYDWDEAIRRVHGKKYGDDAPGSPAEYASRVRFLNQRGFEQNTIQALFRRLRRDGE
ncbi:MAG: regulatory protein RecX [Methylococcaceae bacterium]|nr:regulatory protein RecX [Methylococcaceae bacterium]